jgi:hypothetical protein
MGFGGHDGKPAPPSLHCLDGFAAFSGQHGIIIHSAPHLVGGEFSGFSITFVSAAVERPNIITSLWHVGMERKGCFYQ